MNNFTPRSQQALALARKEADKLNHGYVGTEHILLGLIKLGQGVAVTALEKMGVSLNQILEGIEEHVGANDEKKASGNVPYTPRVKKVLDLAGKEAKALRHSYIGTEHILLGILREGEGVAAKVLKDLGVDLDHTRVEILKELDPNYEQENEAEEEEDDELATAGSAGEKSKKEGKTPALKAFGKDLTEMARKGELDPVIGRENEIERMIQILCRRSKNNPVLIGEAGVGKAQPLSSLVLTPEGWEKMGKLKVGDKITTPEGKETKILGVYPQGEKDIYNIKFADGRVAQSTEDHLWKVWKQTTSKKGKGKAYWTVMDLKSIKDKTHKKAPYYIPLVDDNINKDKELPIHPYILGVLLGDGTLANYTTKLTKNSQELKNKVNQLLEKNYSLSDVVKDKKIKGTHTPPYPYPYTYPYTYTYNVIINPSDKKEGIISNEYNKKIKQLGLTDKDSLSKFIPQLYKSSSTKQKEELIKGLIDKDGFVNTNGSIIFYTSSEQLANDVVEIVQSIGGIAKKKPKKVKYKYKGEYKASETAWSIAIKYRNPKELVSLSYKKNRISGNYQYADLKLKIESIEFSHKEEAQCIMVDDPNHLYVTNNYIVTHNTAMAEGLAQEIANDNVPELLRNKKVISLDLALMVAGTKYRGQFEERIKAVMNEIQKSKNVILFIDELHTIVGAGSAEGTMDASNIIKPALSRGELQCIGATTMNEYRKYIEKDSALERRFQSIKIEAPSVEDTIKILKGIRSKYEAHHKAIISDAAIEAAAKLSDRYITGRFLPDKAIDAMDEAGSKARIAATTKPPKTKEKEEEIEKLKLEKDQAIKDQDFEKASQLRDKGKEAQDKLNEIIANWKKSNTEQTVLVSEEDVMHVISKWTGVPLQKMEAKETEKLLSMEKEIKEKVIGQEEAVTAISKALRRSRADLKDPKRPIGSFIFLGPTGVGKTFLARTLADFMFGDPNAIVQIDMSEYMEKFTASRLIGAPPGYVGHEEGGQLSEAVRRKPYSVVLFDEIEKAHPDVLNLMLQILEEGTITDSLSRKIDFRNTIIIMTSNVGAELIKKQTSMGFGASSHNQEHSTIKGKILEETKRVFKPEFLNRMDDIIVFQQLSKEMLKKIVGLEIAKVTERIKSKGITIKLDSKAEEFLIEKGYDPTYGARPMRRAVEKYLEDPIAEELIRGNIKDKETINVSRENQNEDKLTFEIKKVKEKKAAVPKAEITPQL